MQCHAGIHLISNILGTSRFDWRVLKLVLKPSQTERGFPHETGLNWQWIAWLGLKAISGSKLNSRVDKGCLPFLKKKNSRNFGWDFRSVRTVRVVYRLPKISALSRRARLGPSYNIKLVRESTKLKKLVNGKTDFHSERPNRENRTTFSEFPFVRGIF